MPPTIDLPEAAHLSPRAREFLDRDRFVRRAPWIGTPEQLAEALHEAGLPVLESALRFEASWGGGRSESLSLGALAIVRRLRVDDRLERLRSQGLVPIADLPRGPVAIDRDGAIHTVPATGSSKRIADSFLTLLERHALICTASTRCRLAVKLAPRVGDVLGVPIAEATDTVGAVWQSEHALLVEGASHALSVEANDDAGSETVGYTLLVDDAVGLLKSAHRFVTAASIRPLRPVVKELRARGEARSLEEVVAGTAPGISIPLLSAQGFVSVVGHVSPFRIVQVAAKGDAVRDVLSIQGNEFRWTSYGAVDLEDRSSSVRRLLAGAEQVEARHTTREGLVAALRARGLPILEQVLAFEERWGGTIIDRKPGALGTFAVLQRGFPGPAIEVAGGRTAICIGYIYPHVLGVTEDGTFLVLEDDLDGDEEPLAVAAEASDADEMLERLAALPSHRPKGT